MRHVGLSLVAFQLFCYYYYDFSLFIINACSYYLAVCDYFNYGNFAIFLFLLTVVTFGNNKKKKHKKKQIYFVYFKFKLLTNFSFALLLQFFCNIIFLLVLHFCFGFLHTHTIISHHESRITNLEDKMEARNRYALF